jgi:hypothetical protein
MINFLKCLTSLTIVIPFKCLTFQTSASLFKCLTSLTSFKCLTLVAKSASSSVQPLRISGHGVICGSGRTIGSNRAKDCRFAGNKAGRRWANEKVKADSLFRSSDCLNRPPRFSFAWPTGSGLLDCRDRAADTCANIYAHVASNVLSCLQTFGCNYVHTYEYSQRRPYS